jgi:hypothetical protein
VQCERFSPDCAVRVPIALRPIADAPPQGSDRESAISNVRHSGLQAPASAGRAGARIADLCVWTDRGFSGADPSGRVLRCRRIAQRR